MNEIVEKIGTLLETTLKLESPVLSGNMQSGIKVVSVNGDEIKLEIEAKFYDMEEWNKTKKIKHTGESRNGITNYAYWVNEFGGFFTHNDSKHWVNRVCNEVVDIVCNEMGAEKINELEL